MELGEIIAKNMAKTARRKLRGRHLLFGEYLWSWINTIADELNIDAGKHVFKLEIINYSSEASVDSTLLDLLISSYPTQLHSLIAKY